MISDTILNRNFIIRAAAKGCSKTQLITARIFREMVADEELAARLAERVWDSGDTAVTVKLRRGIRFEFCAR